MHRSFSSTPAAHYAPVSFDLDGRTFHVIPSLPGGYVLDWVDVVVGGRTNAARIEAFLAAILKPPGDWPEPYSEAYDAALKIEQDEFRKALRDRVNIVGTDLLKQIIEYVVDQLMDNRPTPPSSGSTSGQQATAQPVSEPDASTPASTSPASTPEPSAISPS